MEVSFIRKKDLHILTAGTLTYTSDQRFTVLRRENPSMWTLQIKYPQISDSGTYECQINTEPKMSLSYTFNVVVMKEGRSVFVYFMASGHSLNLEFHCFD
uniref:CSON011152 protein n=1 Tax=Culicoides sonorensis TaxID=179676 RepID=A0A336LF58_CULSO